MKHVPLLLSAFFTASSLSSSAMADSSPASGPRPGTVEAMQCLVGQRPLKCGEMFQGQARPIATPWVFVSAEQNFQRGPLVSSNFWGRASEQNMFDVKAMLGKPTKEMDIFDVKFAHVEYTFYVSPAEADGKIMALTIWRYAPHDPYQVSSCSSGHLCVSGNR